MLLGDLSKEQKGQILDIGLTCKADLMQLKEPDVATLSEANIVQRRTSVTMCEYAKLGGDIMIHLTHQSIIDFVSYVSAVPKKKKGDSK
ncbi:MAG: hypothetical protein ACRDL7_01320, partial [Gaiellaceae bacterium]